MKRRPGITAALLTIPALVLHIGCSDSGSGNTTAAGGTGNSATPALGTDCSSDTDCAGGDATTCLKDPTAPTQPGVCTIPNCTAADCGTAYSCCDCGASAAIAAYFPDPVCMPLDQKSVVEVYGCTCS